MYIGAGDPDLRVTQQLALAFDTLGVDKVIVATKPGRYVVPTANGPVQIVSLPWGSMPRDSERGEVLFPVRDPMMDWGGSERPVGASSVGIQPNLSALRLRRR